MQGLNNPIGIKSLEPSQNPFITNPYRFAGGGIGGWKELDRTTLGSAQTSISVTSLDNKRYYMVVCPVTAHVVGGTDSNWQFNNDSGSNYAWRQSADGNTDTTGTDKEQIFNNGSGGSRLEFSIAYIANLAGKEKLMMTDNVVNWVSGAGGSLGRKSIVGKWDNTSDAIHTITASFLDGGGIANDELIVLGWDPADDHTTNFWEELASVETSGSGALSSGTFTAKKYLWVQAYTPSSGNSSPDGYIEFNGDSGTNYVHRRSHNGGTDVEGTSDGTGIRIDGTGGTTAKFHNFFIINRSAQDKLVIAESITANATGGNAPSRTQSVGKWANTSNQITRVDIIDQYASSDWGSGSIIKVWGSN